MADECTDIANKKQGEDLQYFTGLYQVESINANCLVFAIKDALFLMEHQLSACRGQCYNGTSNMSDNRNGVATQTSTEEKSMYTVMECTQSCFW